ncbi:MULTISPECIES: DUF6456 domain-containing protein [Alphaproteobacteria]|uniref:DUF6456 domain-containing protein n=2 Tax=Alphaproteobacteria TaxID=28211 RepID=A0A512HFV7_9HYPH|nr:MULTISPECIES: DUF6456 domain-containing protein [Alphaproteobacteria]GEO84329.1 hypothetical protein RNA01_12610 [Ciceribacter naphthalenivorans]GLR24866.1 hypothetical protein GCM10007920_46600 [Ciceribacter naphthalenivorans]GLT07722.1 hypothetical protein GCM10007926_46600 [Sphingomonas psychrolutea]
MSGPGRTPAERRLLLRVLRLSLRGPLSVVADEGGALHLASADMEIRNVPQRLLRDLVADGLILRDGLRIRAGEGAATYLRRALAEPGGEAFLEQHRVTVGETLVEEGERRPVRRNLAESPLSGLARLKDRSGAAYYAEEAIAAGERLAADFERAGLQPRITASWEPRLSSKVRGAAPSSVEIADSALGARARVSAAIEAMGPELAGVALDVCCFMKGLETVERERQWPARSAKLMLRTALLALARHYAPPPAGEGRSRHHWGVEGYRPEF